MSDVELSICVSTYKGGKMLKACVEEILGYEGSEIEVVVSDNASNDGSIEALQEIKDDRLKIYVNESNLGPFRNYYKALQRGNGRYVMLLVDRDHLVVENLPTYLEFLRNVDYDIIKNAYKNREQVTGPVTVSQWLFYGRVFSHASEVVYKREAFHKFVPLEDSFKGEVYGYAYRIWDIQMLSQYPMNRKACYINGKINIFSYEKYSELPPSRTRNFIPPDKKVPPLYTFDNAVYYFDKYAALLRTMYSSKNDFDKMYWNLYRGELFLGTLIFYEHMINPQSKERYGVYVEDENIDYMRLNDVFLKHAMDLMQAESKNGRLYVMLTLITWQNRLLFKLNHVYERNFKNPKYFWGCVVNKIAKELFKLIG